MQQKTSALQGVPGRMYTCTLLFPHFLYFKLIVSLIADEQRRRVPLTSTQLLAKKHFLTWATCSVWIWIFGNFWILGIKASSQGLSCKTAPDAPAGPRGSCCFWGQNCSSFSFLFFFFLMSTCFYHYIYAFNGWKALESRKVEKGKTAECKSDFLLGHFSLKEVPLPGLTRKRPKCSFQNQHI